MRRTSELGPPSESTKLTEFQSINAKDLLSVSFLLPEMTESVAGGVTPAKGIHLGPFIQIFHAEKPENQGRGLPAHQCYEESDLRMRDEFPRHESSRVGCDRE